MTDPVADRSWPVASSLAAGVTLSIDPDAIRLRLSDRVAARLPRVIERVWQRASGEAAGSRLRSRLLIRTAIAGWAALDRRDWDYLGRFFHPDVIALWGTGVPFDISAATHGWEAWRVELDRALDISEFRHQPLEVVDLGGPFAAARVRIQLTGHASGIRTGADLICLYELRDGKAVRQWSSTEREEIDAWLEERLAELGQALTPAATRTSSDIARSEAS